MELMMKTRLFGPRVSRKEIWCHDLNVAGRFSIGEGRKQGHTDRGEEPRS